MTITEADLWNALYANVPKVAPPLGPNEKTKMMIAAELNKDSRRIQPVIDKWLKEGKIVSVGMRRYQNGTEAEAYRPVEKGGK